MNRHRSLRAFLAAVLGLAVPLSGPLFAEETTPPAETKAAAPAPAAPEAGDADGLSLVFHGEVRMRYEVWKNATDFSNTSSQATDDTFDIAPWRVRMGAFADLGHNITTWADLQGIGVWGQTSADGGDEQTRSYFGTSIDPGTDVDLYEGWVNFGEVGGSKTNLKFGRQEITFDRGLHFSSEPYYNGISHDGVMASWKLEKTTVHGFWTRAVESDSFGSTSHADAEVLGAHFNVALGEAKDKATDLGYYLFHQLKRGDPGAGGRTGITTLGARYARNVTGGAGIIWSIEGAWQEGDIEPSSMSNLNVQAHVLEGMVGYASDKSGNDRSFWVGLYAASGDSDPNDEKQEAFSPLYENLHDRLGDSDIAPLSNMLSVNVGLKVGFRDNHSFRAEFLQFRKREAEQASVSPLSGVVLSSACFSGPSTHCSTDLGREVDFDYRYNATENLSLGIAWAYFIPGGAIEDEFGTLGSTITGEHAAQRLALEIRARF